MKKFVVVAWFLGLKFALSFDPLTPHRTFRRHPSHVHSTAEEGAAKNVETKSDGSARPTSAILRISYDGSRFTGWSASNQSTNGSEKLFVPKLSKKQRRRGLAGEAPLPKGFVRSVEGVLQENLAKIYGNIDKNRIVVEGCSRTDRGVHAHGMIAQIYCLKEGILEQLEADREGDTQIISLAIPGKRIPHPRSPTDASYFDHLPMEGNLSRLAFALNRMRPSDIQITGVSPLPTMGGHDANEVFHPTLSSVYKTYEYRLSVGAFADPTLRRMIWYTGKTLDISAMQAACEYLEGRHDFAAFQGAPRGADDKRKRATQHFLGTTICHLYKVGIEVDAPPIAPYFPDVSPPLQTYKITVQGDRFLYKMVRFLVGSLVAIGRGKLALDDFKVAVDEGHWCKGDKPRDFTTATPEKPFEGAPAHGLVLADINFGELLFGWQSLRY